MILLEGSKVQFFHFWSSPKAANLHNRANACKPIRHELTVQVKLHHVFSRWVVFRHTVAILRVDYRRNETLFMLLLVFRWYDQRRHKRTICDECLQKSRNVKLLIGNAGLLGILVQSTEQIMWVDYRRNETLLMLLLVFRGYDQRRHKGTICDEGLRKATLITNRKFCG